MANTSVPSSPQTRTLNPKDSKPQSITPKHFYLSRTSEPAGFMAGDRG